MESLTTESGMPHRCMAPRKFTSSIPRITSLPTHSVELKELPADMAQGYFAESVQAVFTVARLYGLWPFPLRCRPFQPGVNLVERVDSLKARYNFSSIAPWLKTSSRMKHLLRSEKGGQPLPSPETPHQVTRSAVGRSSRASCHVCEACLFAGFSRGKPPVYSDRIQRDQVELSLATDQCSSLLSPEIGQGSKNGVPGPSPQPDGNG